MLRGIIQEKPDGGPPKQTRSRHPGEARSGFDFEDLVGCGRSNVRLRAGFPFRIRQESICRRPRNAQECDYRYSPDFLVCPRKSTGCLDRKGWGVGTPEGRVRQIPPKGALPQVLLGVGGFGDQTECEFTLSNNWKGESSAEKAKS
jgi:hypothetical protein